MSGIDPRVLGDTTKDDPCITEPFSFLRFAVLFLTMFSSAILLILLEGRPYAIQLSSIVGYTAAVALYTFSRNRGGNQPFRLSCPVVRRQLSPLIKRHLVFLGAIFLVETTALKVRPRLPANWVTSTGTNPPPFFTALLSICGCLALVEIITNRSLLKRAHRSVEISVADNWR